MSQVTESSQSGEQPMMVVGIVRGPHGIAGKFKVESTSGESEHFHNFKEVTLRIGSMEKNYKVEAVEGNTNSLLMKCAGINSPEEVKKLSGAEILVTRDMACPLNEGEYYVEDLKQCKLVYYPDCKNDGEKSADKGLAENSATAIVAGTITDVLEGGAGKLLEVELSESLKTKSDSTDKVLVPFKKEFIGTVHIKDKVVQLMHLWILE